MDLTGVVAKQAAKVAGLTAKNISDALWVTDKGIATFNSSRAYGVVDDEGRMLSTNGISPSTWGTLAIAKTIAQYPPLSAKWIEPYTGKLPGKQGVVTGDSDVLNPQYKDPRCTRCGGSLSGKLGWKVITRKIDGTHQITMAANNWVRGVMHKVCAEARKDELVARDGR